MEYIITFAVVCATVATLGAIAVFAVKDQIKLEKIARNGFFGVVNVGLLLLVLGLLRCTP